MSLKQVITIVLVVVVFNGLLVFSGALDRLASTEEKTSATRLDAEVIDAFRSALEGEVVKELGKPENGFEPDMFLSVFPGLVETDFEGVEASVGFYTIKDGRLRHSTSGAKLMHSAAGAIGRPGMETLLENIADRSGIDLRGGGTVTDVMGVITAI